MTRIEKRVLEVSDLREFYRKISKIRVTSPPNSRRRRLEAGRPRPGGASSVP